MNGAVCVQVQHVVSGRLSIGKYCTARGELWINGRLVPIKNYWAVMQLDKAGIRAFRREHLLFATLADTSGRVVARTHAFADLERRLAFPKAKLVMRVEDGAIVITTDKFARAVALEGDAQGDAFGWFFEDNYFDLLPGEIKTVRILGRYRQGRITARPWYSPHAATIDWRRS